MPTSASPASTPFYVLLDGNRRIGPTVVQESAETECSPIYGFSGKASYEKFCVNSQLAPKPYPLLKGYLQNRVGSAGDDLRLVVVDATGLNEPYLRAATMQAVLEAQERRSTEVTVAYRLMFDKDVDAYRVQEASM